MKSTDPADYQDAPRPIAGMPKEYPDGFAIAPHAHRRGQLIWATSGVMTVTGMFRKALDPAPRLC